MLEDVGEISDILGRSYGTPDGVDEADLDAELACLEGEWDAEAELEGISGGTSAVETSAESNAYGSLPSQPTSAPHVFTGTEATAAAAAPAAPVAAQQNSLY